MRSKKITLIFTYLIFGFFGLMLVFSVIDALTKKTEEIKNTALLEKAEVIQEEPEEKVEAKREVYPLVIEDLDAFGVEDFKFTTLTDLLLKIGDLKIPAKTEFQTQEQYEELRRQKLNEAGLTGENIYYLIENKISNSINGYLKYDAEKQHFTYELDKEPLVEKVSLSLNRTAKFNLSIQNFNDLQRKYNSKKYDLTNHIDLTHKSPAEEASQISGAINMLYLFKFSELSKGYTGANFKGELERIYLIDREIEYDGSKPMVNIHMKILKVYDFKDVDQFKCDVSQYVYNALINCTLKAQENKS